LIGRLGQEDQLTMSAPITTISVAIEDLRRRLEEWRSTQPRRARLPEPLWSEATALARTQGLAATARALRLDYASLKKRLQQLPAEAPDAPPAFVELLAPAAARNLSACVVELEGPHGGRMRIQFRATPPPAADLVALSRILWSRPA
jgi:hypothetical protein